MVLVQILPSWQMLACHSNLSTNGTFSGRSPQFSQDEWHLPFDSDALCLHHHLEGTVRWLEEGPPPSTALC